MGNTINERPSLEKIFYRLCIVKEDTDLKIPPKNYQNKLKKLYVPHYVTGLHFFFKFFDKNEMCKLFFKI